MNQTSTPALLAQPPTALAFLPQVETSRSRLIFLGGLVILLGIGGLGGWAAFAPMRSAALASGVVKVASERKTVQHLEGGIVKELLVREDQEVAAGQVLMRLDKSIAQAQFELLRAEHDSLSARLARLEAERDDRSRIAFPASLLARRNDPQVGQLLNGEERIFSSQRLAFLGPISVFRQRQQQYEERIAGLMAQIEATQVKRNYINEEIKGAEALMEVGMYTKPKYFALKRAEAELEGDDGRLRAEIAQTRELIGETDLRILDMKQQFQKEANEKLQEVRAQLDTVMERLGAAEAVLTRTDIIAPQAGRVIGLQAHTLGGVIRPGAAILDIVPNSDKLIIEARVRPDDIDVVHTDLRAEVRFSAFNSSLTPTLFGRVTRVSADRFTDPANGMAFYLAQVEIEPGSVSSLNLHPGMPAEVFIVTGERTPLDYLLRPIWDQVRRGMLET